MRQVILSILVMLSAPCLHADIDMAAHDVVIIGEFHDNPHHHAFQAKLLQQTPPKAVVFEMLSPEEAASLADVPKSAEAIAKAVTDFTWKGLPDYADVLAASPVIVGAAEPRNKVRQAYTDGAASVFGKAASYGLTQPLAKAEQAQREAAQFKAHCEAMPLETMSGMVEAQRYRDASFAQTVVEAIDQYGAPVVLITGNGHARKDWGVPVYLAQAQPDLTVFSIGQSEDVPIKGVFDFIRASPPADRKDPCAAFR